MNTAYPDEVEYLDDTIPHCVRELQLGQSAIDAMDDTMDRLDMIDAVLKADEARLRLGTYHC